MNLAHVKVHETVRRLVLLKHLCDPPAPSYVTCKIDGVVLFHDHREKHGLESPDLTDQIKERFQLVLFIYGLYEIRLDHDFPFIWPVVWTPTTSEQETNGLTPFLRCFIQSLRAFRRAALSGLLVGLVSCWVVSLLRLSVCVCVCACV